MTKEEFEKFKEKTLKQLLSGKSLTSKDGAFTPMLQELLDKAVEEKLPSGAPKARDSARGMILAGNLEKEIVGMYGLGNSLDDISAYLEDRYDTKISTSTISTITDRVIPKVTKWQKRALDPAYGIVWIDVMRFQIKKEHGVADELLYTTLGVNKEGKKRVLAVYPSNGKEGLGFWQEVLINLKDRGVKRIGIASTRDFEGLKEAMENVFPRTELQLCVLEQSRSAVKYVGAKDKKAFMSDLKSVYNADTLEQATFTLQDLEEKWAAQYPRAISMWRDNWDRVSCFLKYGAPLGKLIYTTNAAEAYHRGIRKIASAKEVYPTQMALLKLVYLASHRAEKKWGKPVDGWREVAQELDSHYS